MARRDPTVFERTAAGYAALRPGYPDALFSFVGTECALDPTSRVLEVGCGPGFVTEGFAKLGVEVHVIDAAAAMLEAAKERLAPYPDVTFERALFETWSGPSVPVDLMAFGMAWHWLDPDVRDERADRWLAPGGTLAVCANWPVAPWAPAAGLYRQHWPERKTRAFPTIEQRIAAVEAEFAAKGRFALTAHARFLTVHRYTSAVYPRVLDTYSDHIDLPAAIKDPLYAAVRAQIDRDGGTLERPYESVVMIARRTTEARA